MTSLLTVLAGGCVAGLVSLKVVVGYFDNMEAAHWRDTILKICKAYYFLKSSPPKQLNLLIAIHGEGCGEWKP